jgi:hypothetical protein
MLETASWQAGGERSSVPKPYIAALLRTRHSELGAASHAVQLSLLEFKELAKAVRALRDAEAVQWAAVTRPDAAGVAQLSLS